MRFTLSWLKRFLITNSSLEKIVAGLNNLGLEVESVSKPGDLMANFVSGQILSAQIHPTADRLKVCMVDIGSKTLQIVCGASNARDGIKVVVALPGARVPQNQMQIITSMLRGVESQGMLCSAEELLLPSSSDGIIELDDDAPVGQDFAQYYDLHDPVIEIAVTPNRGDCLGIYGIARDLHAAGFGQLQELVVPTISTSAKAQKHITISDAQDCPMMIYANINGISNAQSPLWLRLLLQNAGIKPISAVVDVTNYVCHSFAQPMHAFDADKIGDLKVERGDNLEIFYALNDKEYLLNSSDIVITDESRPACLAGIIGGKISSCSDETTNILLEAGIFNKDLLTHSARNHNIITNAKMRFERSVDQHARIDVFKIACALIIEICGGQCSEIIIQGSPAPVIRLDFAYLDFAQKIGFAIEAPLIDEILSRLGYGCQKIDENKVQITVPSWRDSKISADIIEEVIRIYGYENIVEERLPDISCPSKAASTQNTAMISSAMCGLGYFEAVTWSFMSSKMAAEFYEINPDLLIKNPISRQLDYMRQSIVPNLLQGAVENYNRSIKNLKFFEIGPVFRGANPQDELLSITAIASGHDGEINPHHKPRALDVFDIKGDLELILKEIGIEFDKVLLHKTDKKYYHPNISSDIFYKGAIIGTFGQLHPKLLKFYDIDQNIFAFELHLDQNTTSQHKSKGKYVRFEHQTIERDLAFVLDEDIAANLIIATVKNTNSMIEKVRIFDIYKGENIGVSKKSIAINITIKPDRNLLAQEINDISQAIIIAMESEFLAQLRS